MDLTSDFLREEVIKMASIVEATIQTAVDPKSQSSDVYKLEDQVNGYHKSIDDNVFKYIALKKPAARDLRMALSIMKINSELERIADQAVSIRRYKKKLPGQYPELQAIEEDVSHMVKNCLNAFVNFDTKMATEIIQYDQEINELNREIFSFYFEKAKAGSISFDEAFRVIRVAKNFERIGDLTTNIAEDIIFLESGDDIRHDPDFKFGRRKEDS